jgi:predicted CXXCH cytochrome family protein
MRIAQRNIALVLLIFTAITELSIAILVAPAPAAGAEPRHANGANLAVKDSCFACHSEIEGTSVPFKDDVHYHNAISCAACHGGDPKEDDQNLSMSAQRGFKIRVTRQATPEYCGRCHKNRRFMSGFKPQPTVDDPALYKSSVHAKRLAAGVARSAECVDCHGVHNIRAVSDPLSPVHPRHITETCAKCHAATADLFRKSPHGPYFTSREMAGCAACHASHATKPAGRAMLTGNEAVCANCHEPGSAGAKAAAEIARVLARIEIKPRGSKENLDRVRLAVHSFDLPAIRRAAEAALTEGGRGDENESMYASGGRSPGEAGYGP